MAQAKGHAADEHDGKAKHLEYIKRHEHLTVVPAKVTQCDCLGVNAKPSMLVSALGGIEH